MVCAKLAEMIRKGGFEDAKIRVDDENLCVIDFRHPKIKPEMPYAYFMSSVKFDKKRNVLDATVRGKADGFKELYLDYCCEDGANVCKPHANFEEKIVSVEATFTREPLERFRQLLAEML